MKSVLDLASNRTQHLFVGNPLSRELLSLTVTFHGGIGYAFMVCTLALSHSELPGVSDNFPVIGTAQLVRLSNIVDITRSLYHRVNDSCSFIHTNVHLHSEVPIASFLNLAHFRISLFVSVFRRTRRFNKRAVGYRTPDEKKTSVGKILFIQFIDLFIQNVFLKKMAET